MQSNDRHDTDVIVVDVSSSGDNKISGAKIASDTIDDAERYRRSVSLLLHNVDKYDSYDQCFIKQNTYGQYSIIGHFCGHRYFFRNNAFQGYQKVLFVASNSLPRAPRV